MQVRVTPNGILDKDTEVSYVGKGNYTDGLNIRHRGVDSNGNDFGGIVAVKGNSLSVTLANYSPETQTYRVYIDVEDIFNGSISSHFANIYVENSAGVRFAKVGVNYNSTNLSAAVTVVQTDLNYLANLLFGGTFTFSATTVTKIISATDIAGYFDVTTTAVNSFTLIADNIDGVYADFKKTREYHNQSGSFEIVGSVQLDDDMFVFLAGDDKNADGSSIISEIGNIYPSGSGYAYTKLLRSQKLKFHTERKHDTQIERVGDQINIYTTDNFTSPKVIYIDEAKKRTTDGLLFINGGRYDLDTIGIEMNLFLNAESAYITDIEVLEGDGNVKAGNKRYIGRFLTEDLVPTDFLYPTNLINIYGESPSRPFKIFGNPTDFVTNKAVRMNVKNITPGVFKYFELGVIEYAGTTFTAKIVQRFSIGENDNEIEVRHDERGQDNIQLSTEEIVAATQKYSKSKNLRLYDGRLTLSNLTTQEDIDISGWAKTIQHSIEQDFIDGVGQAFSFPTDLTNAEAGYKYGEYQDPQNTLNKLGYFYNDTYRFGIQVQWKDTGKWSSPFWVDDIRIDKDTSNVIGTRRVASISGVDTNLQDSNGRTKVYYVKFRNIDLTKDKDGGTSGTKLRELISGFRFVRSERIPEVLATGMFFAGYKPTFGRTSPAPLAPFFGLTKPTHWKNEGNYLTASQSLAVAYDTGSGIINLGNSGGGSGATDNSNYVFFYSPDFYLNNLTYEYSSSDSVKLLATPTYRIMSSGFSQALQLSVAGGSGNHSAYQEYNGNFALTTQEYTNFQITHSSTLLNEDIVSLDSKNIANAFDYYYTSGGSTSVYLTAKNTPAIAFKLSSKAHGNTAVSDKGYWYGQLFRNLGANRKYPANKELSSYGSTGQIYFLPNGVDSIASVSVYGGDCFTQKTTMPLTRLPHNSDLRGAGYGVSFYSQNRSNTQMFTVQDHNNEFSGPGYIFPQYLDKSGQVGFVYFSNPNYLSGAYTGQSLQDGSIGKGLFYWLEQWPEVSNQNNYDQGYDSNDGVITEQGYDVNANVVSSMPTRIAWSSKKLTGSQKDNYRIFQPLNFADLDYTHGEITHHEVVNNSFYTIQERSVQRQYFRDASLVGGREGTDIVIGSGSILAAPGVELTSIGSSKKESVIKGKNPNGKDTLYWYNDRLQKLVRLAGDGVSVISDRGLSTYLINNGKFISQEFYPLSGRGVHGVWNDRYGEAIFTFKYNDGVSNKAFTVVYDEIKNGFVSFHSYTPNIYFPFNNTFFSPNPSAKNTIYIHDGASNVTFYGTSFDSFIEMVMNYDPNISKYYEAVQINSEEVPTNGPLVKSMTFETSNHVSYLDTGDFELREDLYYSPIKNDSTGTGINSGDTSRLFGRWLKLKINLTNASGLQKLINSIVKFRTSARLYNQ